MRKFMNIAIPVLIITTFILVMLSGDFLKKPLGKDDNIPQAIDSIIQDINEEKWADASKKTSDLTDIWKKIVRRVQYSSERDEINSFSANIARLRGAILAKDKTTALVEIKEAYEHWDQLGK